MYIVISDIIMLTKSCAPRVLSPDSDRDRILDMLIVIMT